RGEPGLAGIRARGRRRQLLPLAAHAAADEPAGRRGGGRLSDAGGAQVARTIRLVGSICEVTGWPSISASTLRASSTPPSCQFCRTVDSGGRKLAPCGVSS